MKILLPALSPTMETGNLVKWLVKEGQTVNSGDILAEIETDKATMELESPDDGIIEKIVIPEGTENIPVNDLIAVLKVDDEEMSEEETSTTEIVSKNKVSDKTQKIDSTVNMGSVLNVQNENNSNWTEVEITMREALNQAIEEEMTKDEDVFLLGEEVAEYDLSLIHI